MLWALPPKEIYIDPLSISNNRFIYQLDNLRDSTSVVGISVEKVAQSRKKKSEDKL